MTRFALKGLLGRKLRTILTALAIVLGVTMVSGTYILTDSIDQAFDQIFTDIRKGSSAVITGKAAFDLSDGSGATAPPSTRACCRMSATSTASRRPTAASTASRRR